MMLYILHTTLLIAVSYFFYKAFLQRETFFQLNRWVLMGSMLLAFSLPFLQIPEDWSLRAGEEPVFSFNQQVPVKEINQQVQKNPSFEVTEKQVPIDNEVEAKTEIEASPITNSSGISAIEETSFEANPVPAKKAWKVSWTSLIKYIYLTGLAIFLLNFLIQLFTLLIKRFTLPYIMDGNIRIVELNSDEAPYSFLDCIFINPEKYDWETYNQILEHEKIHIQQGHSFDLLLAELMVALQWFNPFAWLHRKIVSDNLEYFTDKQMLHKGTNRESYQMNLLRVAVPQYALRLANNYNHSILKKRIFMMNSKKSSVRSSWKYLALIALFGFSVLTLNAIKSDDATDQFPQLAPAETTELETNDPETTEAISERPQPITVQDIVEEYNLNPNRMAKGHWDATIKGKEACFKFKAPSENEHNNWWKPSCFQTNEFTPALTNKLESFSLKRTAGTIDFKGTFSGSEGKGTYSFTENETFKAYLEKEGLLDEDEEEFLFHCFFADIDQEYISYLKKENFEFGSDELAALGHFEMDLEYLKQHNKTFSAFGFEKPGLEDLIALEIHDVKPEFIKEYQKMGLTDLGWEEVIGLSIHNVTPDYVKGLRDEGLTDLSAEEVVGFAIHNVDADFIKSMKNMGFRDFTAEEIMGASIHNVTPEYLESFEKAGLGKLSMEEITSFAIHNVQPEDIKAFKAMGFRDMSPDDIIGAHIHGVTPEYLEAFEKEGLGKMDMEEITAFAIHDVQPENIKAFKAMGFRDMSPDDIVGAHIHGVTPEYLAAFEKEGLGKMDMEEITAFAIHDVQPEDIKAFKAMGFREMTPEDIVGAHIHGVTPEYLAGFEKVGLGKLDMEEITSFAIHDVQPEDVKAFKAMGFREMTPDDIIGAQIHGVTPEYLASFEKEGMGKMSMEEITQFAIFNVEPGDIKQFKAIGFKDISAEEIIQATIHDVSPDYIKSIRDLGLKDASMEEFVHAKIMGVTPEFIKQKQAEGKKGLSLEKYTELKIHPMD
ncbi:MAG: hypothetical protein DWQ02_12905 [Bacteroidetes bacterium]|nr:MAG: hypothetical protein DWQ02_12905 [Bacteroidota bacterium]